MNLQDINDNAEKLYRQTDSAINRVWNERLKVILAELSEMYMKYSNEIDPHITWTEFNKYNRLKKELDRIEEMMKEDYKVIAKEIKKAQETNYLQTLLMSIYLYEQSGDTPIHFTVPDSRTITAAIEQPIEFIKLIPTLQKQRAKVLERIRIDITQSIIAGEGYQKMAKRLRENIGMAKVQSQRVARTEGGRAFSQAQLDSYDKAVESHARIEKFWIATLDERTRSSHRHLDGKTADASGNFKSRGCIGPAPRLFVGPASAGENINCRCTLGFKVNGIMPETRRSKEDGLIPYVPYKEWAKSKGIKMS